MALVQSTRLPVRATPLERAALAAAAHLADFVGWRMERRAQALQSSVDQRQARIHAEAAHEDAVTRAHSLGLLR